MESPPDAPASHLVYSFRYRDERTGKWIKARYKASPHEINSVYREWQLLDQGELRESAGQQPRFSPFAVQLVAPNPRPIGQRFLELGPHRRKRSGIDADERRLVRIFLRRLIVYEARKGRFERVGDAADLLADIQSPN